MNLFYQPEIPSGNLFLDEEESKHCVRVLRRKEGDQLRITDGNGFFYDAVISKADARQCEFVIEKKWAEEKQDTYIHIAISPTKNADRIEWFVEKTVEIGINEITLIDCHHTERTFIKVDRLKKIAISAMKQSLKASLPVINSLTSFKDLLKVCKQSGRFIAFVDSNNPIHLVDAITSSKDVIVLIGPEGDFSADELQVAIQEGFQKVSLGKSRLRTETAGMVACHSIHLALNR